MYAARKECNQRVARGVSCYFLKRAYRVTLLIKRCTHYQYNTSTLTWSNSQGDETIDDLAVKGSDDEVGKESKDSLNRRACTLHRTFDSTWRKGVYQRRMACICAIYLSIYLCTLEHTQASPSICDFLRNG